MPSNNTCWLVHYWQGLYGGLGHLVGPERSMPTLPHIPYALDNGAFGAYTAGREWDADLFVRHVERYAFLAVPPAWLVCPDVVADGAATLARWGEWAPRLDAEYGIPLALAVQDGMDGAAVCDLEPAPALIFVGGSTEWKWRTVREWCCAFPRVHVGRVNSLEKLEVCARAGAESCDGTGWFRGKAAQIEQLGTFLARQAGKDAGEVARVVAGSRLKGREQMCLPGLRASTA